MNSKFAKIMPVAFWVVAFISSLMLLSLYDAQSFMVAFMVLASGVFYLIAIVPQRQKLYLPMSPFLFFMMAFWAMCFVSVFSSATPLTSMIFFCFMGMLPLSFIFAALVPDKETFFMWILRLCAGLYGVLSLFSLLQYFYIPQFLPFGRVHYPFGDPNSLGGFLSLGAFCAYGTMIQAQKKSNRAGAFFISVLIFAALLTTGSRGAFLCFTSGMIIFHALVFDHIKQHWKTCVAHWIVCGLVFLILSFSAINPEAQTPSEILSGTISGQNSVFWDRPCIWASTWRIIQDNFWFGTGIGTFFQVYPAYRNGDITTAGHMAHNDLLQFWAELGILGPLFFISALCFAILKTFKVLAILPKNDVGRVQIAAVFCALGAMVLNAQITFLFYVFPCLIVSGVMLGYWFYKTESVLPSKMYCMTAGSFLENALVKFCCAMLLVSLMSTFFFLQSSEIYIESAKRRAEQGDMKGFAQGINRANEMSFGRNARALALASTVPSRIVLSNYQSMTEQEILDNLLQAESLLDRAIKNSKTLSSSYHEKALVAEMGIKYVPDQYIKHHNGSPPKVLDLIETAFRYDPLHPGTRLKYAHVLKEDGQSERAYEILKAGLVWQYTGTKGMQLFETIISWAQERGDTQTVLEAKAKIQEVYAQGAYIIQRNQELKDKPYMPWKLILGR